MSQAQPDYGAIFQSARPIGAERTCHAVAYGATLAQLCLGAGPLMLAVHLGRDPDAAYWVGGLGRYALAGPAFAVLLHILHLVLIRMGKHGLAILLATGLPALLHAFLGMRYAAGANAIEGLLHTQGCKSELLPQAAKIQETYDGAKLLWLSCLRRLLSENGGVPPLRRPSLLACHEWTVARGRIPSGDLAELEYLASVEAAQSCGGFCAAGPALFSAPDELPRQGSACAGPVAAKLRRVARDGVLLLGASLAELGALAALFVAAKPLLERLGYKSGGGKAAGRGEAAC